MAATQVDKMIKTIGEKDFYRSLVVQIIGLKERVLELEHARAKLKLENLTLRNEAEVNQLNQDLNEVVEQIKNKR